MNGREAILQWANNEPEYIPADATKTQIFLVMKGYISVLTAQMADREPNFKVPTNFPWDESYWKPSPIAKRNFVMVGFMASKLYEMEF